MTWGHVTPDQRRVLSFILELHRDLGEWPTGLDVRQRAEAEDDPLPVRRLLQSLPQRPLHQCPAWGFWAGSEPRDDETIGLTVWGLHLCSEDPDVAEHARYLLARFIVMLTLAVGRARDCARLRTGAPGRPVVCYPDGALWAYRTDKPCFERTPADARSRARKDMTLLVEREPPTWFGKHETMEDGLWTWDVTRADLGSYRTVTDIPTYRAALDRQLEHLENTDLHVPAGPAPTMSYLRDSMEDVDNTDLTPEDQLLLGLFRVNGEGYDPRNWTQWLADEEKPPSWMNVAGRLADRGLVDAQAKPDGTGNIYYFVPSGFTSAGEDRAAYLAKNRTDAATRNRACRSRLLQWLYDSDAHDISGQMVATNMMGEPAGRYFGIPFTEQNVHHAFDYLVQRGLVKALSIDNFDIGWLTANGSSCVEDYGADIQAWTARTNGGTTITDNSRHETTNDHSTTHTSIDQSHSHNPLAQTGDRAVATVTNTETTGGMSGAELADLIDAVAALIRDNDVFPDDDDRDEVQALARAAKKEATIGGVGTKLRWFYTKVKEAWPALVALGPQAVQLTDNLEHVVHALGN